MQEPSQLVLPFVVLIILLQLVALAGAMRDSLESIDRQVIIINDIT